MRNSWLERLLRNAGWCVEPHNSRSHGVPWCKVSGPCHQLPSRGRVVPIVPIQPWPKSSWSFLPVICHDSCVLTNAGDHGWAEGNCQRHREHGSGAGDPRCSRQLPQEMQRLRTSLWQSLWIFFMYVPIITVLNSDIFFSMNYNLRVMPSSYVSVEKNHCITFLHFYISWTLINRLNGAYSLVLVLTYVTN